MKSQMMIFLLLCLPNLCFGQIPDDGVFRPNKAVQKGSRAAQRAESEHWMKQQEWILRTFGDQKVKKNQQAYKKYQYEQAKKKKAKQLADSKGTIKKK